MLTGTNYISEFKKFITSQYLTKGLRITFGAIIPAIVLYKFNLLTVGIAMPLGALMVSLADAHGPIHHRKNGMIASNIINFVVALIIGYSNGIIWLLGIELTFLSFWLSLSCIYGNRASAIGLIGTIVMVLSIDVRDDQSLVFQDALFMLAGGIWYMLLSLVLYSLRPYRLIQQALGENILSVGAYLRTKARLYSKDFDNDGVYKELLPLQIEIHNGQEQVRELLFKARGFTRDSTTKGRVLLMMFMDSVDLFEQIMTSQQNYKSLHDSFDSGNILDQYEKLIIEVAEEMEKIGLLVQGGFPAKGSNKIEKSLKATEDAFIAYRKTNMNADNLANFISLRHILNSITDIVDRINRLRKYTHYSSEVSNDFKPAVNTDSFVASQEFDIKIIWENLTLQSNAFRHALRVSISILCGFIIAQLLPFGHSYWILLTIVTILKPAYSISKRRNGERLVGTLIGAGIGFVILYVTQDDGWLLAIMIMAMIVGYSFINIKHMVGVAGITIYVMTSFHFLHPSDFRLIAADRVIDTAIGSSISFLASLFFLPKWEIEQVNEYIQKLMRANQHYFAAIAKAFYDQNVPEEEYKLVRKESNVALANLTDAFQRLLSEPQQNTRHITLMHQLVVSIHMQTSHIATLSTYAKSLASRYRSDAFATVAQSIELQMSMNIALSDNQDATMLHDETGFAKIREMINDLMQKRIAGFHQTDDNSSLRKSLSSYKTITDQFEIIYSISKDIYIILNKMRAEPVHMPFLPIKQMS